MPQSCRVSWCYLVGVLFLLLSSGGCGASKGDLPKTFAVRGAVVYQEDGKPMADGSVQFEPFDGPMGTVAHVGTTKADGRFEIRTVRDNATAPGVPEGTYRVRLTARMGADQQVDSAVLPGPYKVEPNDNNTFNLTMPGKSPP